MATQVQLRRGNTADNDGFTGANGEVTVDTERKELRVHDGSTSGGFPAAGTPSGTMLMWAGGADSYSTVPDGYLLCDGREVSRSTYADLDAVLSAAGYPFGSGNGSTTFNLPDMRGRFPLGLNDFSQPSGGDSSLTNRELGDEGGDEELQSHNHYFSDTTSSNTHSHTVDIYFEGSNADRIGVGDSTGGSAGTSSTQSDTHSHTVAGNTNNTGSGNAGNMPPFTALNFIIKT